MKVFIKYNDQYWGEHGLVGKAEAEQYDSDSENAQWAARGGYTGAMSVEPVEDKVLIRNSRGCYWAAYGAGLTDKETAHRYDREEAERIVSCLSGLKIEEIDTLPLAEQLAGASEVLAAMDAIVAGLRTDIAAKDALIDDLRESSRRFHRERQKADATITKFAHAFADLLEAA